MYYNCSFKFGKSINMFINHNYYLWLQDAQASLSKCGAINATRVR